GLPLVNRPGTPHESLAPVDTSSFRHETIYLTDEPHSNSPIFFEPQLVVTLHMDMFDCAQNRWSSASTAKSIAVSLQTTSPQTFRLPMRAIPSDFDSGYSLDFLCFDMMDRPSGSFVIAWGFPNHRYQD